MQLDSKETLLSLRRLTARLVFVVEDNLLPVSESLLFGTPEAERWSIGRCLAHIHQIAKQYQPLVRQKIVKALERADAPPVARFKTGWLADRFVRQVQLQDDNLPYYPQKTPSAYAPPASIPKTITTLVLADLRDMMELLRLSEQVSLKKVKVPMRSFPYVNLSLGNMLRYLVYHYERHVVQAQRAQYEAAFTFTIETP